jgi:hypothetical protein
LESLAGVAAVAKGLIGRMAAPAQRYDGPAREPECVSGSVFDNDVVARDAKRPVVITGYFQTVAHLVILLFIEYRTRTLDCSASVESL